jgi:hypothetical protein
MSDICWGYMLSICEPPFVEDTALTNIKILVGKDRVQYYGQGKPNQGQ